MVIPTIPVLASHLMSLPRGGADRHGDGAGPFHWHANQRRAVG